MITREQVANLVNSMVPPEGGFNGKVGFLTGLESGIALSEKRPDIAQKLLETFRSDDYAGGIPFNEEIDDILNGLGVE
jgi:hypothetical protein